MKPQRILSIASLVAILLATSWFFYWRPKQLHDAAEESIARAFDACATGNRIVYSQALLDAQTTIRHLDAEEQLMWEGKLSNRLKLLGCPY